MTEIITYRLSATGIWQYEFCREEETVGSVASVVSVREPARIESREVSWYSRFDMDTDIIPGVSRKDQRNGPVGSSYSSSGSGPQEWEPRPRILWSRYR